MLSDVDTYESVCFGWCLCYLADTWVRANKWKLIISVSACIHLTVIGQAEYILTVSGWGKLLLKGIILLPGIIYKIISVH